MTADTAPHTRHQRPYDQDADPGLWLPRRDWGAYALLAGLLISIGSVEGVLIYRCLQLMGLVG